MNCIIIDDEPLARAEMEALIREVSDLEIVGTFSNAPAALGYMREHRVDLMFLDIEMPMVNGLEFAAQVSGESLIVFTTAYPQYALRSYELDAIDYLLKPVEKGRLERTIKKAATYAGLLSEATEKSTVEGNSEDYLVIKSERRFHRIAYADIRYIEGLKDYVVIHTRTQKLITAMNLKNIHQKIAQHIFMRVSKSYLINRDYIDSFDHHTIYLGESEIPLGEVYKKEFFSKYTGGALNPEP